MVASLLHPYSIVRTGRGLEECVEDMAAEGCWKRWCNPLERFERSIGFSFLSLALIMVNAYVMTLSATCAMP